MFTIQRSLKLTIAIGGLAIFACSSGLPDDKNQAHAGNAGSSAAGQEDAGASDGGTGEPSGGSSSKAGAGSPGEAGTDSKPGDGGSDSAEPHEPQGGKGNAQGGKGNAQGGKGNAQGGTQNASGSGNAHAGSVTGQGGELGGDETGGAVSVVGSLAADCQAAPPVAASVPQAQGLLKAATGGHDCNDTFEPNASVGDACRLTLGAKVDTQLDAPDDLTDNFVFHAEGGVTYTLDVSTKDCPRTYGVEQLSVTAKGQIPQIDNESVAFAAQRSFEINSNTTGDELVTFVGSQSCRYQFTVSQSTAQGLQHGADYEPNNTPSTASTIALDHWVLRSQLSAPQDAYDYFIVPVQGNVTYTIRVSTEGCQRPYGVESLTVTGSSWIAGEQSQQRKLLDAPFNDVTDSQFTALESGQELLQFYTAQSCAYKFYVIPSTVCGLSHDEAADYEPNNTVSTATEIAVDQPITAQLQQPDDKSDYYILDVEPQTNYTLTVSTAGCPAPNGVENLAISLWSGRTDQLLSKSTSLPLNHGNTAFPFTTGKAPQELLRIGTAASCLYKFSISKG